MRFPHTRAGLISGVGITFNWPPSRSRKRLRTDCAPGSGYSFPPTGPAIRINRAGRNSRLFRRVSPLRAKCFAVGIRSWHQKLKARR